MHMLTLLVWQEVLWLAAVLWVPKWDTVQWHQAHKQQQQEQVLLQRMLGTHSQLLELWA